MEKVKWRPVPGYDRFYEVNSLGEVRSVDRTLNLKSGKQRKLPSKPLRPKDNGSGYLFVTLSKDGERKSYYVHRLVAICFLGLVEGMCIVNHIDGNPRNNNVDNLEWVTHNLNVAHAYRTGLNKNQKGNHFNAVGVIDNEIGASFATIKDWCEARGINYSTGRNIVNGYSSKKTIDKTLIIKIKNDERSSNCK
jgi:hypothetical protein